VSNYDEAGNLTQNAAAYIMEGSMLNPDGEYWGQYGWTYPPMAMQLIVAHKEIHGNEDPCTWTARHDILRYICPHGYTVKMVELHRLIGSARN